MTPWRRINLKSLIFMRRLSDWSDKTLKFSKNRLNRGYLHEDDYLQIELHKLFWNGPILTSFLFVSSWIITANRIQSIRRAFEHFLHHKYVQNETKLSLVLDIFTGRLSPAFPFIIFVYLPTNKSCLNQRDSNLEWPSRRQERWPWDRVPYVL